MDRRHFLRLIVAGVAGHELDIDRLLWIPGQRTIFLPSIRPATHLELIALEYERIIPKIRQIFEMDDRFYSNLINKDIERVSNRSMKIPLNVKKR